MGILRYMSDFFVRCGKIEDTFSWHFALDVEMIHHLTVTDPFILQASGLTVVADKLNFFRYISHFRCIHRGAFFAEMRTTAVRKLLPEAWGEVYAL